MYKECVELNTDRLSTNLRRPLKIIAAGNGILIDGAKRYFDQANKPKEFAVINGAGHSFNEDGAEEKLFKETLKFIK